MGDDKQDGGTSNYQESHKHWYLVEVMEHGHMNQETMFWKQNSGVFLTPVTTLTSCLWSLCVTINSFFPVWLHMGERLQASNLVDSISHNPCESRGR